LRLRCSGNVLRDLVPALNNPGLCFVRRVVTIGYGWSAVEVRVGGSRLWMGAVIMSEDSSVFTVEGTGERTVVSFRDWLGSCYREGTTVFVARAGDELKGLISQGQCKVLAIDMTPVDPMPSVFLGLLATLRKGGVKIELLHPSASVRTMLDVTNLAPFFPTQD
jgi:hypothetical protein